MAVALFNLAALSAFIPHGHCYLWKPELVGLHLVSDALIALAYYSIPITLFYFVRKRQDLPFSGAFILFAVFIIACGTTHLMEIWTLWHPTYWVAGTLKAITAFASVSTAILLLPIIPKALALPSPDQVEAANRKLQAEIAERQRLEKERDGFFRLSPDLLCITTFDGYFRYMNPAWEAETGFTTEELLANPYINVIYADDRAALAADAQKVVTGIDTTSYESRVQCKAGSVKWIAWSASAAPEEQLVYVVGRNITKRKQIEEALRESEIRFRRLIQDLHVGVLLQGSDAEILLSNPEALKLLGLTEDQLLGKTSFDPDWNVVHEDGSPFPGDLHPVPQAIATRQSVRNVVMGVYRPQIKDQIWLLVNAAPQLDEHGNVKQVVCTFSDISDRKRIEDERKIAEETIKQQHELLQTIVDHVPAMLTLTNPQGQIQWVNRHWETVLGWSAAELQQRDLLTELYPNPTDYQFVVEFMQAATGRWHDFKTQTRQGKVIDTAWANVQLSDGSNIGIGQDITERKQTEVALRESEARFQAFMNNSPIAAWITDENGRLLYLNQTYFRLFKMPSDYVAGVSNTSIHPPEIAQQYLQNIRQVIETKQVIETIESGVRPDGAVNEFLVYKFPILTESGQCLVGGVAANITDRKQMEELLRHKTAKLEAIFQAIPDAIVFADLQRCIQSVNPALTRLFDYQPEEVFGQKTELLYANPEAYRNLGETRYYPTASEQLKPYEVEYRRKNNATFMSETVGSVVKDSNGETIGFIGVIRDITERKQIEERLKLQSIILRNMTGGVCLIRIADGGITYTNPKFEHMFGYDPGELDGKHVSILNYPSDQVDANEVAQTIIAAIQEQGEFTYEVHNVKKDGTSFWCQGTASVLEHPEYGTVVVAVQYDISDRKRAEAERRTLVLKLQQSNQELEQFAFIASHDLKEPLRTTRNFCSLLQSKYQDALDEKGQDYLNRIQTATQRMQTLIDDLLSLARVATQAKPFVRVNLTEIIRDVTSRLQKQLQRTGGQVEVENLPIVYADPTQLSQLFQNLISNALKFHQGIPPVVRISSQFQPPIGNVKNMGFHKILVEDNGIGLDEKYRDRIFGTFERLHGHGEYEGTGIGLAICKKIAERHGGTITVRSTPGHGSTFILTLPIR